MQCNADIEKNVGIHYTSSSNPDIGKVTNFHWLVKLFQLKLGNTFSQELRHAQQQQLSTDTYIHRALTAELAHTPKDNYHVLEI